MQITNTNITVYLSQNTIYSTASGLWTLSSSHQYFNAILNSGRVFAGYLQKSDGTPLVLDGELVVNVYYLFKDGTKIGLSSSFEKALAKTPVIFTSVESFYSFKQTGNSYLLTPINSGCCEPDYFETQYPEISSYSDALDNSYGNGKSRFPIPCYLPKKISFTWSPPGTINFGTIDLYLSYYSANPTSDYSTTFRELLIYGNGQSTDYALFTDRFTAQLKFYHKKVEDKLLIKLTIATWKYNLAANWVYTFTFYEVEKDLTYDSNGNVDDDFFTTIPDLVNMGTNDRPSTLTLTTDGNYVEELLPASITLAKINSNVTINGMAFTPTVLRRNGLSDIDNTGVDEHGWTVNDYGDELPETITLNKVSVTNYESDSFITSVNVTNKIKLKLANSLNGYFGYLFFIQKDESFYTGYYLPGYFSWKFEPVSADPFAIRLTQPTKVSYGPVQFRLFKMAGTPMAAIPAPQSSWCYADVFYMVKDPSE